MRRVFAIVGMSVLSALLFYTSSMLTHAQVSTTRQSPVPSTQNQMPIGTRITSDDQNGFKDFDLNEFREIVEKQNLLQREASSASAAAESAVVEAARSSARAPRASASSRSNASVISDNTNVPFFKPDPGTNNFASSAADTVNTESKQATRGCGGQRPTFLDLLDDDDLFCSTHGEVFPVLIGGECPITTCIIKSGNKKWPGDALALP